MRAACDHEGVLATFASRKRSERLQAVADAYADLHADDLLARMIDSSTDTIFEKWMLAAYLGDFEGDAGDAALARAFEVSGPGTRDLRCAVLTSLAKRQGDKATPILRIGLSAREGAVKDCAVIGLAVAGNDSAWDDVFDRLRVLLRRRSQPAHPHSEVSLALAYLAQHLAIPDRRHRLVDFVRNNWGRINEPKWFDRFWPDARPDGPSTEAVSTPDPTPIREWARHPHFERFGPPPFSR